MAKVLVVFHSMSGNTEAMAKAVAEGAKAVRGTEVVLKRALDAGVDDLLSCQGVAVGSPDYFSYMAGGLKDFFDRVYYPTQGKVTGKPCAIFASAGGPATRVIETMQRIIVGAMKCTPVAEAVGVSGAPPEESLAECRALGEKLAQAAASA